MARSFVRKRALCGVVLAAAAAIVVGRPALAKDYFLTIGGGFDPTSNQASIENNVLFFQRVLAEQRPDGPRHDLYFADGDSPVRDVQYLDAEEKSKCPPARRIMTELFGAEESIGLGYRDHRVTNVTGATERAPIARRFRELGRELDAGDRLIVYVTGHGSEAAAGDDDPYDYRYDEETQEWVAKTKDADGAQAGETSYDTSLYLWDSEPITASEFGRWLDRLDADVRVVLVMVQCYGGGFAHAIFRQNNAELGLSAGRRCGFFAQVHDRPAAGCTPDAQEKDYQEYSTYFFAALGGKSRTGASVAPPDYDGDGSTSWAEAHAYAVIESDTVDIPVRTSDELLRRYSRLGLHEAAAGEKPQDSTNPLGRLFGLATPKAEATPEWHEAAGPLAALAAMARPDRRTILEQLSKKLDLDEGATVQDVRQLAHRAKSDLQAATSLAEMATKTCEQTLAGLKEDVCEQWPELIANYSPATAALTDEKADEFVAAVEGMASYDAHREARHREQELTDKLEVAHRAEARLARLLWTIDSVVLAANLEKAAPAEIVERYQQLIALEEETLAATQ